VREQLVRSTERGWDGGEGGLSTRCRGSCLWSWGSGDGMNLLGGGGTQQGAWKSLVRIEANSGHADSETPQGPGKEEAWS